MELEDISQQDFEYFYLQNKKIPDYEVRHDYRCYIPPLTPTEPHSFTKKNKCSWIKLGELGCCGEPCEDVYCYMHLRMRLCGSRIPLPCLVCGVGVINFEFICKRCKREKDTREKSILFAKEFGDNEPSIGSFDWHLKNQGVN